MPRSWDHVSDVINYIENQIEEYLENEEEAYAFINLYAGSDRNPKLKASDTYNPNKSPLDC